MNNPCTKEDIFCISISQFLSLHSVALIMATSNDFAQALQRLFKQYEHELRQIDITFDRKLADITANRLENLQKVHHEFGQKLPVSDYVGQTNSNTFNFPINVT